MRWHLLRKTLAISAFLWVFFLAYFHVLRNPSQPVTTMPLTGLDSALPFEPWALWAYVSLWLYVGVPTGLMLRWREIVAYGVWVGSMCVAGLAIFWLWPTAVPARLPPEALNHPGFAMLQGVDAAGNACPSLHVASATFTALWARHLLQGMPAVLQGVNAAWFALIVWSTLATRQHVVLDALAGVALALPFAWASLRWRPGTAGASSTIRASHGH